MYISINAYVNNIKTSRNIDHSMYSDGLDKLGGI